MARFGAKIDAAGKEDSKCDEELVRADESASDVAWCCLGYGESEGL